MTQEQIAAYKTHVPSVTENEPMAKHTSFRIGGAARLYVVASTSDALIEAVTVAIDLGLPYFIYGGGSNLLVADNGFDGIVIQAANRGFTIEGDMVRAEAGCITGLVARKSVEAGLTGFEWAVGVPGTIGGAVYGNAGCYGEEMKDAVVSVDAVRLSDRERVTLSNAECGFDYRESRFKHDPHIILGCKLKLASSADKAAGKARMDEIMKTRKEKQPLEQSSCGCAFKNPPGHSAGQLIDSLSLKGTRIGDIQISDKHGNFFINQGNARAQDVIALISLVKMKVRDELGIELMEEVQYLGF